MRERYRYSSRHLKIPRETPQRNNRAPVFFAVAIPAAVALVVVLTLVFGPFHGSKTPAKQLPFGDSSTPQSTTTTATTFDLNKDAPLPTNRIVAAYGIVGGVNFNGPASTPDSLASFYPQLQQLGQQYAQLDPTHPVKLGIDLVVNVIQPCAYYAQYCSSFADDSQIQPYIDFCKEHNLLLFFDLQLGVMPVKTAVTMLEPYLKQYSFTEIALDTEFHFPNNPQGYSEAAAYPGYLGWMGSGEINWAITELANISLQNHLPRKVLVVHEWDSAVLPDKNKIQLNPDVSVVLQSDGWGGVENKLSKYQAFVQQQLLQYGGYKLFFQYTGDTQFDVPLQSPADVMQLFPEPLFISYQ
jgi:hypothetical protein